MSILCDHFLSFKHFHHYLFLLCRKRAVVAKLCQPGGLCYLPLEDGTDEEVEKHHYHIAAPLDTKTQKSTYVLLLQKITKVEKDTILEKVYKTLEDPEKNLDRAVKPPSTKRCHWWNTWSRLKGLEVAPALCHQFTL